jgi:hypothetical protein
VCVRVTEGNVLAGCGAGSFFSTTLWICDLPTALQWLVCWCSCRRDKQQLARLTGTAIQ